MRSWTLGRSGARLHSKPTSLSVNLDLSRPSKGSNLLDQYMGAERPRQFAGASLLRTFRDYRQTDSAHASDAQRHVNSRPAMNSSAIPEAVTMDATLGM